jgi:CspA family cold shock protein
MLSMKGRVKWFDDARGFGFIRPEGGGEEIFCHYTAIVGDGFRSLPDGQKVEFEMEQGQKGPQAKDVRKID